MYAIVDCNNFYASCERAFNPILEGKPIVVLSNNDGCVISRSEEAKRIGIKMGAAAHIIEKQLQEHHVHIFSSNYTLYGDMSDRVMNMLAAFVPQMEIYSIDEAFLDMHHMPHADLNEIGITIRKTIRQNTGIPVCVGIAPTKTLAKMANRYAKKKYDETGVYWAATPDMVNTMLAETAVGDIWGIGHQYALLLLKHGFKTALDLTTAPDDWVRTHMAVVGLRTVNELRSIPSLEWEVEAPAKKNIGTQRSFGILITDKAFIKEALSNYAATCALKLRQQGSVARELKVSLQTNPFRMQDRQYFRSIVISLPRATNSTPEIIKYALHGYEIIFKQGYNYAKCGVELRDFIPENMIQSTLFMVNDTTKMNQAMHALDALNATMGKELVRFGIQGFKKAYKARAAYLSPKYTTDINQVITIHH